MDSGNGGQDLDEFPKPARKEIVAWAMYDFANSAYSTVVATTIYSAYFVRVVAADLGRNDSGAPTLLLTLIISASSLLIVVTAPVLGAAADARASKKRFLFITTIGCVLGIALLAQAGPGEVVLATIILLIAGAFYGTGENLIAAFLPEIANRGNIGRISAFGWMVGYVGGLALLGICLLYVRWAESIGQQSTQYVPVVLLITAACFALAAVPTFLFLKERALPDPEIQHRNYFAVGFERLKQTYRRAPLPGPVQLFAGFVCV